jgi:hypothetical protein
MPCADELRHAPLPGGTTWTYEATPNLRIGFNCLGVANSGTRSVIAGLLRTEGFWRYLEPQNALQVNSGSPIFDLTLS